MAGIRPERLLVTGGRGFIGREGIGEDVGRYRAFLDAGLGTAGHGRPLRSGRGLVK